MLIKSDLKELAPAAAKPDMAQLLTDFRYAVHQRDGSIFRRQRINHDTRHCLWRFQSDDGRKWTAPEGKQVFPWPGASDSRVRLTELYVNQDVAVALVAWRRMRSVVSTNGDSADEGHAARVTNVLRWMKYTQMTEAPDEMELLANIFFERGTGVLKTIWSKQNQLGYDTVDLETIVGFAMQTYAAAQQGAPMQDSDEQLIDLPRLVLDPSKEAQAAEALGVLYPDVRTPTLAKLVRDIRNTGTGQLPRSYEVKNRPAMRCLTPNEDIFISPEASDINEANNYERELLTESKLREREQTHGWSKEWIEAMIKSQRGRMSLEMSGQWQRNQSGLMLFTPIQTQRLFEVVHGYEWKANEDGVPGIYYTCFSAGLPDTYATHALLPYDHGEMPFIHFSREKKSRPLDDSRGYGEIGGTWQNQIKSEWDSRVDRAAITTLPPSYHPSGEPPDKWGPGVQVPTDRPADYGFFKGPEYDQGSREVEQSVRDFADEYFGRPHPEKVNIYADAQRQHTLDRFLTGCGRTDAQTLALMQQYMPDEFYFRIVGDAKGKPIHATREEIQGRFDVSVSYDSALLDPERRKEKIEALERGIQLDANGRTDRDEAMTLYWEIVDPSMGERLLRAPQDAAQAEIDDEDTVFSKIFAGLNVDIRPGQAYKLRLDRLKNILQTNQLAMLRYEKDPQFKEAMDRRLQQFTFQLEQKENAVTGRFLGTSTQAGEQLKKAIGQPQGAEPQMNTDGRG